MKGLSRFVVALADLAEAEGRAAKEGLFRLAVSVMMGAVASVLFLLAIVSLTWSAYRALLLTQIHPAGALAVVAVVLLLLAAVCLVVARMVVERRS